MILSVYEISVLNALAKEYQIDAAVIAALIEIESNGVIYVSGTKLPLIRWEGHYFYKFLAGEKRDRAIQLGLASPHAGAITNPGSIAKRYDILREARSIDDDAAFSSISIGVGQVMGAFARELQFPSARTMFATACTGFRGQLEILFRYIVAKHLIPELQRHDWTAFARAYNGPNYQKNHYHTKLEEAYARYAVSSDLYSRINSTSAACPASSMLRLGSSGAGVRELQALLLRSGGVLKVDGDFGPFTRRALLDFQRRCNLEVDGIAGPQTFKALALFRSNPAEHPGQPQLFDLKETKYGGWGSFSGLGSLATADKLEEIAGNLMGSGGSITYVADTLYIIGALLVLGGISWTIYGLYRSRQTFEGSIAQFSPD